MIDLDEFALRNLQAVLGNIVAGGTMHRELSKATRHFEADYHGRFLVELFQNANDQVLRAKQEDGRAKQEDGFVQILRTREFIAVANEGLPFDDAGIRAITSLALSDKDANLLIGNKGIGFKSVFEVSLAPEVYSVAAQGGSLLDPEATRFQMSQTPFGDEEGESWLKGLVRRVLDEGLVVSTDPGDDLEGRLREAAWEAPFFKFPKPISLERSRERLASLDLDLEQTSTLIVLPLKEGEPTARIVESALDEIHDPTGAFFLFLPGVARVRIVDRVRNLELDIRKTTESSKSLPEESKATHFVRRITTERTGQPGTGALEVVERVWHVIEGICGGDGNPQSAELLSQASASLPGHSGTVVDRSPVAVALPETGFGEGILLGANGKICIGLPTKTATGSPAWIHSHFFGRISRKDLDLDIEFNKILIDECLRLHGVLIDVLKLDRRMEVRRLATLAFEKDRGPLADWLYRSNPEHTEAHTTASGAIVITDGSQGFVRADQIILPKENRFAIVAKLLESCRPHDETPFKEIGATGDPEVPEWNEVLPVLPHRSMIEDEGARRLLLGLPGYSGAAKEKVFLERAESGTSPLEWCASVCRLDGPDFWEEFFDYVFELCKGEQIERLRHLKILPVGRDRLASAEDQVFLTPTRSKSEASEATAASKAPQQVVEEEDVDAQQTGFDDLPERVRSSLDLLDPSQIPNRRKDKALSIRLTSKESGPLVLQPRRDELILKGIIPALKRLSTSTEDLQDGLKLLKLAAEWCDRLGEATRLEIRRRMPAPVGSPNSWSWGMADHCYFSEGWGSKYETLLIETYGDDRARMLVPYEALGLSSELAIAGEWRTTFETLGVHRVPRVIEFSSETLPSNLFIANGNYVLEVNFVSDCPHPELREVWGDYLHACAGRSTRVGSGQTYRFDCLTWIDGLDSPRRVEPIVKMMLKEPESYIEASSCKTRRSGGGHSSDEYEHLSPWIWMIRSRDLECIPTGRGTRRPSECWVKDSGYHSRHEARVSLLHLVADGYSSSPRLLQQFGVTNWHRPDPGGILRELHRCAGRINETGASTVLLEQLVRDLYEKLSDTFESTVDRSAAIRPVGSLPLFRSGQLTAVSWDAIRKACVDDDPERLALLGDVLVWPISLRGQASEGDELIEWIRSTFGTDAAKRSSEMEVCTRFVPHGPPRTLKEALKQSGVDAASRVLQDLTCLLCLGKGSLSPQDPAFALAWERISNLQVIPGSFPPSTSHRHFLELRESPPKLYWAEDQNEFSLLGTLWKLGLDRDVLQAYLAALRAGRTAEFFEERGLFDHHRDDVLRSINEFALGQLDEIRSAIFAVWRLRALEPKAEFDAAWREAGGSTEKLANWLGQPFSKENLETCLICRDAQERSLAVLHLGGASIQDWQEARRHLGLPLFNFVSSGKLWDDTLKRVQAILKTAAARRLTTIQELTETRDWIETISNQEAPRSIVEDLPDFSKTLRIMVDRLSGASVAGTRPRLVSKIIDQFETSVQAPLSAAAGLRIRAAPQRDLIEYEQILEFERGRRAAEWCREYLRVAQVLAAREGESVPTMNEGLLLHLTDGYWANRFPALLALRRLLRELAPRVSKTMVSRGAFKAISDLDDLRRRFPECFVTDALVVQAGSTTPRTQRMVSLLGREIEEDQVFESLGGSGALATLLDEALAKDSADPLLHKDRAVISVADAQVMSRGGSRRNETAVRNSENLKALVGQVGELYVYRWLKRLGLESFDQECWISSNRTAFLACEDGDDAAGFDFKVIDTEGKLTGRTDSPTVLMEVKSKFDLDDGRFFMTAGEWERAIEASRKPNEEYWIIVVEGVGDSPRITQFIKDPYQLSVERKVVFEHRVLSMRVAT